jgi:putative DNA primase/helicase
VIRAARRIKTPIGTTQFDAARLFEEAFGREVKWSQAEKAWYIASRTRRPGYWSREDREGAALRMQQVCAYLSGLSEPPKKAVLTARFVEDGLRMVRPHLAVAPDAFNRDPLLLGAPNGVVNLQTGRVRRLRPEDMFSRSTAVPFDPDADCPTWERHLRVLTRDPDAEMTGDPQSKHPSRWPDAKGDPELMEYLQELVGLSLIGDQRQPTVIYLYGYGGANGKDFFIRAIERALGDYANPLDENVLYQDGRFHTTGVLSLRDLRFVTADEIEDRRGSKLNTARLKKITGRGKLTARGIAKDNVSFIPSHTLWITSNFPPNFGVDDDAVWRRVQVIETGPSIPMGLRLAEDRLEAALQAEGPGILRWAVEGAKRYLKRGRLPETPHRVRAVTESMAEQSNTLRTFLGEAYEQGLPIHDPKTGNRIGGITVVNLRVAYDEWLKDHEGRYAEAPGTRTLAPMLRKEGVVVEPGTANKLTAYGLLRRAEAARSY